MKLLFDENMPRKLRHRFRPHGHEVVTVQDLGWSGKPNGELLRLMQSLGVEAMITGDRKMLYEQNWQQYPLPVLVLRVRRNRYEEYLALMPQILALLAAGAPPGPTVLTGG